MTRLWLAFCLIALSAGPASATLTVTPYATGFKNPLAFVQDPTDPQDSAEYIAQLASFSSVEQAVKTNAKLDLLLTNLALSQADGVIGHTVTAADGSVSGVAKAIRIVEGGAAAILESGDELLLGSGVVIS